MSECVFKFVSSDAPLSLCPCIKVHAILTFCIRNDAGLKVG